MKESIFFDSFFPPIFSPSLTLGHGFYTILRMEILHLGEDLLRQKSLPVEEVNDELRATLDAMFDTLKATVLAWLHLRWEF